MKNLDAFINLSQYLKSYELYLKFSEIDQRNRSAIEKIEHNLRSKEVLTPQEQDELTKYRKVLDKVDFNNKLLEENFNNFDFSENEVEQAFTDYKLYAFDFIVDTILSSMEGKEFSLKKDVINHVRIAERVVRKHFEDKFYIPDDVDKVFEKATEHILEGIFDWNSQSPTKETDSITINNLKQ